MKIAYIAHPISNDPIGNLEKIRAIVRNINLTEPEIFPFVPYYADIVSLNDYDPDERARGIKNDTELFNRKVMDELWLFGDHLSKGMIAEVQLAIVNKIPVVSKSIAISKELDLMTAHYDNYELTNITERGHS